MRITHNVFAGSAVTCFSYYFNGLYSAGCVWAADYSNTYMCCSLSQREHTLLSRAEMLLCPHMGVPVVGDGIPIVIECPWGQTLWTMEPVCIPKPSISHPFIQSVREEYRGFENSIAVSCRSVRCAVETAWCYENLMWKISCRRCIFNGDHTDAGIITGALPLTSRNVSCTAPKQLCTSRLNLVGRLKLLQVFQLLAKNKKKNLFVSSSTISEPRQLVENIAEYTNAPSHSDYCCLYFFLFFILMKENESGLLGLYYPDLQSSPHFSHWWLIFGVTGGTSCDACERPTSPINVNKYFPQPSGIWMKDMVGREKSRGKID